MPIDFKSPRVGDEYFEEYWNMYLPDIENRENLKQSHLNQLKILCDLSVQYDQLQVFLEERGLTYKTEDGRNGLQIKPRPELAQFNKIVGDIRAYSKMLGLVLYKDTELTKGKKKNEFADEED